MKKNNYYYPKNEISFKMRQLVLKLSNGSWTIDYMKIFKKNPPHINFDYLSLGIISRNVEIFKEIIYSFKNQHFL